MRECPGEWVHPICNIRSGRIGLRGKAFRRQDGFRDAFSWETGISPGQEGDGLFPCGSEQEYVPAEAEKRRYCHLSNNRSYLIIIRMLKAGFRRDPAVLHGGSPKRLQISAVKGSDSRAGVKLNRRMQADSGFSQSQVMGTRLLGGNIPQTGRVGRKFRRMQNEKRNRNRAGFWRTI